MLLGNKLRGLGFRDRAFKICVSVSGTGFGIWV